jgi:hypothetical protein
MIRSGSLEYALARIAARVRARPSDAEWARIEIVRSPSALLAAARAIPAFAAWIGGITADWDAHAIEARFRAHWRATVAEIVRWMPPHWQSPVEWCAALAELPAIAQLARGGAHDGWMASDAVLGPLRARAASIGFSAALREIALAPLASALGTDSSVHGAWLSTWRDRLPNMGDDDRRQFTALARTLRRHRDAFAATATGDGWPLRRELAARLEVDYHRSVGSPAAVFAYVALVALDAERLRGEVAGRIAFPSSALAA